MIWQALVAALVAAVVAFGLGEAIIRLLAHHNRAVARRYLPAVVTFVVLLAVYAYVVNVGAGW
jgi:Na+-driven multidrug efflux pump